MVEVVGNARVDWMYDLNSGEWKCGIEKMEANGGRTFVEEKRKPREKQRIELQDLSSVFPRQSSYNTVARIRTPFMHSDNKDSVTAADSNGSQQQTNNHAYNSSDKQRIKYLQKTLGHGKIR